MTISLHGQEHRQHSANIYNFWKNTIRKDHDFNMECYFDNSVSDYDITEDFQTQFQQNSDAILSLIETLGTVDIPKKS